MNPYYLMIVDVLPSSRLEISKYLDRHGISIHPDIRKENKYKNKCIHDVYCGIQNELIMMKDFRRDDDLNIKYKMDYLDSSLHIFENSHIANLIYCKLSNKKLYKQYMKEFKNRRRHWTYYAIVIANKNTVRNKKEGRLLNEVAPVLKQSQIPFKEIKSWHNLTYLRKDILKEIQDIHTEAEKKKPDDE